MKYTYTDADVLRLGLYLAKTFKHRKTAAFLRELLEPKQLELF